MSLKSRILALLPGQKAAGTNENPADPRDDFGLHVLYDGSNYEQELLSASPSDDGQTCLEPVEYDAKSLYLKAT